MLASTGGPMIPPEVGSQCSVRGQRLTASMQALVRTHAEPIAGYGDFLRVGRIDGRYKRLLHV